MNITQPQSSLAPEVRVVEASAGSGKTYALAKRYVQLLLNPRLQQDDIPLKNILAITFTNKAAFEMKKRILLFLKKISLGALSEQEEEQILRPIGLTTALAQPQALRVMDELIHHYNFFQVQTIDSFINALLSGCAFKIGLSAGFKIKRNHAEYLEYSLDRMIEESSQNKKSYEILARFLHQYLFLENKTGWFPKTDMLDLLLALYGQSHTYGRDFEVFDVRGDALLVRKKKILAAMQKLREQLPANIHATFLKTFDQFLLVNPKSFDLEDISTYFSREEVPVTKGPAVSAELSRAWFSIHQQLSLLCQAEAYSLFNPYVEVYNWISEDFKLLARQDDVMFLPELNRRARSLFDEGMVTVEELYYRLATRYHHYLLDEFQDTSRLQWDNLRLMIEEALSTGGTFFYVGDKKQAIYGFRGGEVKLFDEVQNHFKRYVTLETLQTNFRSQKAIVDFNNQIFSDDNLQRYLLEISQEEGETVGLTLNEIAEVQSVFHGHHQECLTHHFGGYVKIEYVDLNRRDDRHEETRLRILALIKQLHLRYAYRDIAILARSNADIEAVTSWLLAEGIAVQSERTLNIREHSLIQELIAFLRFLDSPGDNLSFAQFISGQLFTTVSQIPALEIGAFLFKQRSLSSRDGSMYLYKSFQEAYPDAWGKYVEEFFKNVGLFPLYELTSSLIKRLNVIALFPGEQGFVMRLLELIKEQEEDYTDLAAFLEHFETLEPEHLFVNVVESDAVKVLTVHKSKGLEFPVVIIPFLGMKIHAASGGGLGQQSYILDLQDEHIKLLRIKSKYLKFSEKLHSIHHREWVRSLISELNNVYVALTRASQELYAFIPAKMGSSRNMVRSLIPATCLEIGKPNFEHILHRQVPRQSYPLSQSKEHDWIHFLKEEFVPLGSDIRTAATLRGEILHALLSGVLNLHGTDVPQVIHTAVKQTQARYSGKLDWSEYQEWLTQFLGHPHLAPYFYVPTGRVEVERELVDERGNSKRIDRLIATDTELTVLDFKTRLEGQPEYFQQVRDYQRILKALHPNKKVNGLLVSLSNGMCQEVRNE